jgi:hypothetical protein
VGISKQPRRGLSSAQKSRRVKVPPGSHKRLLIVEGEAVDKAMSEAVRHALLTHKRAGHAIASWKDGRVVIIPAEEIPVGETPADSDESRKD